MLRGPLAASTRWFMRLLFIFPGQGAQYRGMGRDLCAAFPSAAAIYERATASLGIDMSRLCFDDPDNQLNLTRFTQPALLTHSVACWTVLNELTDHRLTPAMAAGHSLGEYSALVATGSLSFEGALQLVSRRGTLMGQLGEGEMTAFALSRADLTPLAEATYCGIAACNLADQTVAGGRAADLAALESLVKEQHPRAARKMVRLKTEGAFHTYYMTAAAKEFRADLAAATFDAGHYPVLSNYTGAAHDLAGLRARLFYQLFHPVRWLDNLQTAFDAGMTTVVELGGGLGSGDGAEGKRPNLESVVKKAAAHFDRPIHYLGAIHETSLKEAATQLIQQLDGETP